jgi:hypothetical protein
MSTRRNLLLATFVILPLALLALCITPVGAAYTNASSTTLSRPVKGQHCGQIVAANGSLLNATQAQLTANCFWHAFQLCSSASLVFTTHSIDTGTNRTLLVSKHGKSCNVKDTVQNYVVPRPPSNKQTYTCNGVTKESNDLLITACGADGNLVIPFA